MLKRIFSPVIIVLLILVTYFSNRVPRIEQAKPTTLTADFSFSNVTISMHSGGKKLWTILAKESTIYNQTQTFFFHDVNGSLFSSNSTMLFSSPTGVYQVPDRRLKLVKTNAQLKVADQSYFIVCDEIELNSATQLLTAHGNLLINSDNIILKGQQMIANLAKQRLHITHHVQGSINPTVTY